MTNPNVKASSPHLSATSGARRGTAASTSVAPLLNGTRRAGVLLGASAAAIYLRFDGPTDPDVVALVPTSSVRLPLAMVVAGALPALAGDPPVEVGGGTLRVGDDVWMPTRWFEPRPRGFTGPDADRLTGADGELRRLSTAELGVEPERARAAITGLLAADPRPACTLLGEGPGLTPAGDDVIAGGLATCALRGDAAALGVAPEILDRARMATTSLSAALLWCAAAGQVVPQAARFLASLCGTGDVADALSELRSVGTTSGTALAFGIVAALP